MHIDLIGGLGRDAAAVRFLREKAQAQGIVSPSGQVITAGRKEGLITIHRLFALDSPSLDTGLKVRGHHLLPGTRTLAASIMMALL